MIAWSLVFLAGGVISLLYWWGINKSMMRLATIAAARTAKIKALNPQPNHEEPGAKINPSPEPSEPEIKPIPPAKQVEERPPIRLGPNPSSKVAPPSKGTVPPKPFPSFQGFHEKLDKISVSFGDSGIKVSFSVDSLREKPGSLTLVSTPAGNYGAVTLKINEKNDLLLSFSVWGGPYQQEPVKVVDNEFEVNGFGLDRNFSPDAFEVINKDGTVVFQMTRKTPSQLVFRGIFPTPMGLCYVSDSVVCNPPSPPANFLLRPIFKYPSHEFPGKYADGSN